MPAMEPRVVWGRWETMAIFCPRAAFRKVDLPTLGLPSTATAPQMKSEGPKLISPAFDFALDVEDPVLLHAEFPDHFLREIQHAGLQGVVPVRSHREPHSRVHGLLHQ